MKSFYVNWVWRFEIEIVDIVDANEENSLFGWSCFVTEYYELKPIFCRMCWFHIVVDLLNYFD